MKLSDRLGRTGRPADDQPAAGKHAASEPARPATPPRKALPVDDGLAPTTPAARPAAAETSGPAPVRPATERVGASHRAAVRSADGVASRAAAREAAAKAAVHAPGGLANRRARTPAAPSVVAAVAPSVTLGKRGAAKASDGLTGLDALRATVRSRVVAELGPTLSTGAVDEDQIRALIHTHLDEAARGSKTNVGPTERTKFVEATLADMLGWGALTPLMADPTITEIMVNGLDSVWYESEGRIQRSRVRFPSMTAYRMVIDRMLAVAGRRVDEASPMADGRLPDGSRVNAVIPPLVVGEPILTIRRFPEIAFTTADLVAKGSLSQAAGEFLGIAIEGKLSVLISGGTGTGKTTLLNVLSSYIPEHERVITIEDAAELRLGQPHVVTLEARPANIEGAGLVSIRDLVRNALRMRPDRIVVGEVRDAAALDMLQAMNTGHEGSMTTVHANSPRDALSRIETMVLMAGVDLPLRAIREQIVSGIDLIVQLGRLPDGSRVITQISEVQGREGDVITLQDVFIRKGNGALNGTGLRPRSVEKVTTRGLTMPAALFRAAPTESSDEPAAPAVTRKRSTR